MSAFLYLAVASSFQHQLIQALQTLHVGGLFPFSGLSDSEEIFMKGDLIQTAVNMAVNDIQDQDILPGYQLQLHINDTQVRAGKLKRNIISNFVRVIIFTIISLFKTSCARKKL